MTDIEDIENSEKPVLKDKDTSNIILAWFNSRSWCCSMVLAWCFGYPDKKVEDILTENPAWYKDPGLKF